MSARRPCRTRVRASGRPGRSRGAPLAGGAGLTASAPLGGRQTDHRWAARTGRQLMRAHRRSRVVCAPAECEADREGVSAGYRTAERRSAGPLPVRSVADPTLGRPQARNRRRPAQRA